MCISLVGINQGKRPAIRRRHRSERAQQIEQVQAAVVQHRIKEEAGASSSAAMATLANAEHLAKSVRQYKNGQTKERELIRE